MKTAVMKRAWEIYRTLTGDRNAKLAQALKQAWAEAKTAEEQPETTTEETTEEVIAMKKIRICGKTVELDENTEIFVGKYGSCLTVLGERAKFTKALKNHLVFTTESGAIVKTDYYMNTVGKARKEGYWVVSRDMTNDKNVIHYNVKYWNHKKLCFENK